MAAGTPNAASFASSSAGVLPLVLLLLLLLLLLPSDAGGGAAGAGAAAGAFADAAVALLAALFASASRMAASAASWPRMCSSMRAATASTTAAREPCSGASDFADAACSRRLSSHKVAALVFLRIAGDADASAAGAFAPAAKMPPMPPPCIERAAEAV